MLCETRMYESKFSTRHIWYIVRKEKKGANLLALPFSSREGVAVGSSFFKKLWPWEKTIIERSCRGNQSLSTPTSLFCSRLWPIFLLEAICEITENVHLGGCLKRASLSALTSIQNIYSCTESHEVRAISLVTVYGNLLLMQVFYKPLLIALFPKCQAANDCLLLSLLVPFNLFYCSSVCLFV